LEKLNVSNRRPKTQNEAPKYLEKRPLTLKFESALVNLIRTTTKQSKSWPPLNYFFSCLNYGDF